MNEKPLTLKEVRAAAKRAAKEIEENWPKWKKDLSEPSIITIVGAGAKAIKVAQAAKDIASATLGEVDSAVRKMWANDNKSITAGELIEKLSKFPKDTEVMVLDGFNAGGKPRIINLGPVTRTLDEYDVEDNADCEGRVGDKVLILGYGCY